jgi:GxxExxY protein
MNTDESRYEAEGLNRLTELVIGCAYTVHNTLGVGFLEKVYENALVHELRKAGLTVLQQVSFDVVYDGVVVGQYTADLVVEGVLLLELKVARAIDEGHVAQCLNYLAATRLHLGLILNFHRKVQVKRLLPRHD